MSKPTYYILNKEKLLKKVTCECGSIVSKQNLKQHLRSQIHRTYLRLYKIA